MSKTFSFLVCLLLSSASLFASNKYWDINGAVPGAGGATPAGTWDLTSTNWTTDATGSSVTTVFATNDVAIFSAGTDATGAFTISVPSALSANGIIVEEGAVSKASGSAAVALGTNSITVNQGAKFSIDGSTTITASSGANISLNGSTFENRVTGNAGSFVSGNITITVGPNGGILSFPVTNILNIVQTGTPGTLISGSGGITKVGVGVLAIATTCTYNGPTVINEGELRIRTSANRLPLTTAVTVNSPGILNLNGVGQQIGTLSGNGDVGLAGATLTISSNGASTTYSGSIKTTANAGAGGSTTTGGSVTKSGTGSITFAGANDFTGTLTLSAGGINVAPGGVLCNPICDVIVNGGTLALSNAAQSFENLGGTGGGVVLGAGHMLTINPVNTAASSTFAGVISGPGGLVKNGGTTETFTGANTYTGPTLINAGRLIITTGGIGLSAYTTLSNATNSIRVTPGLGSITVGGLNYSNQAHLEFDLARLGIPAFPVLTNTGPLGISGTVPVDVKGFDGSGTIPLLSYTDGRSSGSFVLGTLPPHFTGSINDDLVNKQVSLVASADSVSWVGDALSNWDVNDSTNLVWKLTTGGTPTFYQESASQGDTVRFDDSATGSTSITLPGTVLPYNVTVSNVVKGYTFAGLGKISGAASLIKNGAATLTLTTSNDYTGGSALNGGTAAIATPGGLGTGPIVVNAATLQISNVSVTAPDLTLSNGAALNGTGPGARYSKSNFPIIGNGATVGFGAVGAGDQLEIGSAVRNGNSNSLVVINGAGTVLLSSGATAASAYAGSWRVNSGTLRLSDINALGNPNNNNQRPIELAGGTLETRVTAGGTFSTALTVSGDAAILADRGTLGTGVSDTFGSLKIGAQKLTVGTGANTTNGSMSVFFPSPNTLSGTAVFNVTNGVAAGTTVALAGINETGGPQQLVKVGNGTLTLFSPSAYTGGTTVGGGVLIANSTLPGPVTVTNGALGGAGLLYGPVTIGSAGSLSPGFPTNLIATLTVTNNVSLGGTLLMEINRTNLFQNADQLVVGGTLTCGGTLTVTNIGPPLVDGDTFALLAAGSTIGAFAATNLPPVGAGTNWWTTNNFSTLTFNISPTTKNTNYVRTAGIGLRIRLGDLVSGAIAGKTITMQSLSSGSQGATISFDGTYIHYVPANNNNDSFTYTINDGRGGTPSGTINVTVLTQAGAAQNITVSDGSATIDCAGIPGYPYLLQRSTNLVNWVTILTTNAPAKGLFSFKDTFSDLAAAPPSAYYRVAQP